MSPRLGLASRPIGEERLGGLRKPGSLAGCERRGYKALNTPGPFPGVIDRSGGA